MVDDFEVDEVTGPVSVECDGCDARSVWTVVETPYGPPHSVPPDGWRHLSLVHLPSGRRTAELALCPDCLARPMGELLEQRVRTLLRVPA